MEEEFDLNPSIKNREFIFPLKREQITFEPTDNRIYVADLLNISEASSDEKYNFINNLSTSVGRKDSIDKVIDQDNFDMMFSFIYYSNRWSISEKSSILDIITRCKYFFDLTKFRLKYIAKTYQTTLRDIWRE